MSKLLRPSGSCPKCGTGNEGGCWHSGTVTVQPNGKRKLTDKGYWLATCVHCKFSYKL